MANLLVEIGNTALKAAWSDGMTLGKTFRYQGEKWMDFTLSLTRREKPAVLVVSSVYVLTEEDCKTLSGECGHLLLLDKEHKEPLLSHDFRPGYPPFHQQGYQQLFNSLFERNVDKSNIDSLAPPQDEFQSGDILQRAISVCPLVHPLPDRG